MLTVMSGYEPAEVNGAALHCQKEGLCMDQEDLQKHFWGHHISKSVIIHHLQANKLSERCVKEGKTFTLNLSTNIRDWKSLDLWPELGLMVRWDLKKVGFCHKNKDSYYEKSLKCMTKDLWCCGAVSRPNLLLTCHPGLHEQLDVLADPKHTHESI